MAEEKLRERGKMAVRPVDGAVYGVAAAGETYVIITLSFILIILHFYFVV